MPADPTSDALPSLADPLGSTWSASAARACARSPPCSPPWATGCRAATCSDSAALDRPAGAGHRGHGRPRRRERARRRRRSWPSPPRCPPTNPEVVEARRRGVPVRPPRRPCWPPSPPTRQALAVAGTHGKTTTSSMLALVLQEGGLAPVVHHRRRRHRARPRRGLDRRRVVRGRGRRERRHLPRHARHGGHRHQRRARPPRVLRLVRGPARRLRPLPRRHAPGRGSCAPTTHVAARLGREAGALTYGTRRRRRLPHGRGHGPAATASRFDLYRRRRAPGHGPRARCPARTTPATPAPPLAMAPRARRALRRPRSPASARFGGVARRFEHRGEAAGVTFVDDYAHLPTEVAAALAAGRDGGLAPASSPCSSPTATAAPRRCGATSPTPSSDADLLVLTDIYAAGEAPPPGRHRASCSSTPCSTPTAAGPLAYLPSLADVVDYLRRPAPARRPVPHPRRRRPHHGPRPGARPAPGARGRRPVSLPAAVGRRRSPTRVGPAAEPDAPLGAAHHLPGRRAGRRARAGRVARRPASPWAGPLRCPRPPVPVARRRPRLQPARRRRGLRRGGRRAGRRASPAIDIDGTTVTRRRRRLAAGGGPAEPRRRAHRLRVGRRRARLGRWRGAHERRRPRLRHGRDAAEGPRRRPAQRRGWVDVRAAPSSSATARSALAPHQVVVGAELGLAAGDRVRRRGRDLRDRALAPRAPARRRQRRLGVHQPARRLRRPAHRRGRRQGPAASARPRCPTKHANFIQADDGRLGRRRRRPHGRGPGPGARRTPASTSTPRPTCSAFDPEAGRGRRRPPPDRARRPRAGATLDGGRGLSAPTLERPSRRPGARSTSTRGIAARRRSVADRAPPPLAPSAARRGRASWLVVVGGGWFAAPAPVCSTSTPSKVAGATPRDRRRRARRLGPPPRRPARRHRRRRAWPAGSRQLPWVDRRQGRRPASTAWSPSPSPSASRSRPSPTPRAAATSSTRPAGLLGPVEGDTAGLTVARGRHPGEPGETLDGRRGGAAGDRRPRPGRARPA